MSTVPGDGKIDFDTIFKRLASYHYECWFVVEAEQDPKKANPLEYAKIGYEALNNGLTAAGYKIG